jgi:NIMA (never in mitosis gene a)-related kinase
MSPEVCQSKPYDYKSDVWALGCILYELATLKHAFTAENLLGLVFKIVQDKQDPIPDIYS